jgi:hypothetical protein
VFFGQFKKACLNLRRPLQDAGAKRRRS